MCGGHSTCGDISDTGHWYAHEEEGGLMVHRRVPSDDTY